MDGWAEGAAEPMWFSHILAKPSGSSAEGWYFRVAGVEARTGFALLLEADIGRGLPPREVGACTKPFPQLFCPDGGTARYPTVSTTCPLGHYIYTSCPYLTYPTSFQHSWPVPSRKILFPQFPERHTLVGFFSYLFDYFCSGPFMKLPFFSRAFHSSGSSSQVFLYRLIF